MSPASAAKIVARLRATVNRFGGGWAARKTSLLRRCGAIAFDDARSLLAYHDALLFMLAYPESPALLASTQSELTRVAERARALSRRQLFGTGIAWSEQSVLFSYDIAAWLAKNYPENAEVDCADESTEALQRVLKLCLPPIEAELLESDFPDADLLLDEARGGAPGSRLTWLVAQLDALPATEMREHLFESLQLFVKISPKGGPLSLTFARGHPAPPFFHTGALRREVAVESVLDEPAPAALHLSLRNRCALLDTARAVLAMLGRETDAISASSPEGVEYLELDRGAGIALYSMRPERRFPIETHVGFMLFKNGIPVAYGGGWPFLEQCRFGINVLAPFRGGESAYLFCQAMRVFRHRFAIDRFVVEPYQFGAGNREGLLSGAFWFYYRLGFRPVRSAQASLAASEFTRIRSRAKYRSPLAVMRRLARADLELRLSSGETPWVDPKALSLAATEWIGRVFAGDRKVAEAAAMTRVRAILEVNDEATWPPGERSAFRVLSILVGMIPDLEDWSPKERRDCLALMRAKGARDETLYFELVRRHDRLRHALVDILQRR
jgi:hypothetical protein